MTEASSNKVYDEMKRLRSELECLEKTLANLLSSLITEENISPKERKKLQEIKTEIEQGKCVSLEDVKRKRRVKEAGKPIKARTTKSEYSKQT